MVFITRMLSVRVKSEAVFVSFVQNYVSLIIAYKVDDAFRLLFSINYH